VADLNKVILIGRLTRDPELKYLPSGSAVCEFGFAVGRKYKLASGEEREESTFIDCTIFAKGGEVFNQYMKKGSQAYLEGRLKLDQWDDKTTGQKRSKLTVIVENFQFLGGRNEGQAARPAVSNPDQQPAVAQPAENGDPIADIPF
jgi:single-strand DNA-binding protein